MPARPARLGRARWPGCARRAGARRWTRSAATPSCQASARPSPVVLPPDRMPRRSPVPATRLPSAAWPCRYQNGPSAWTSRRPVTARSPSPAEPGAGMCSDQTSAARRLSCSASSRSRDVRCAGPRSCPPTRFGELCVVLSVPTAGVVEVTGLSEALECVLPDRLACPAAARRRRPRSPRLLAQRPPGIASTSPGSAPAGQAGPSG